jgi:glycine cleavage system H protein
VTSLRREAVSEIEIPEALRYSLEDEWIRDDGDRVVIGITDYAQQQLGDIVFVELPEVGAIIDRGEAFGVIESVKAVSDLFAPITGKVLAVNDELAERPEAVNEDCYGDGWILAVSSSDPGEIQALLDVQAYRKHVDERAE